MLLPAHLLTYLLLTHFLSHIPNVYLITTLLNYFLLRDRAPGSYLLVPASYLLLTHFSPTYLVIRFTHSLLTARPLTRLALTRLLTCLLTCLLTYLLRDRAPGSLGLGAFEERATTDLALALALALVLALALALSPILTLIQLEPCRQLSWV